MDILKRNKRFGVVFCSILIILMLFPAIAHASYAYNYGRTSDLRYADDCVYEARRSWIALGKSYNYYFSGFSESTFLNNIPLGYAVYAYTHGSTSEILDNYSGVIARGEVSTKRNGRWQRLVFLDACNTATDSLWASSWGISNGDGSNHTYIGWVGYSYDNYTYYSFTRDFWGSVGAHYTILQSLQRAQNATGITNWRYYGNPNWNF